jgi:hypothetical protein
MLVPARGSGALPLLRRWRAWQLERLAPPLTHQQARLATTTPTTAAASDQQRAPLPQTGVSHADVVASVAAALERLGVRPGLGCEVCDGLLKVDIALHLGTPHERRVAVDVTPRPPDTLGGDDARGTGRQRSPETPQRAWALAQARRQALKAHGWNYVQLPAIEFLGAMGNAEEEGELLRRTVLEPPAEGGGGGAHVCGSGCSH